MDVEQSTHPVEQTALTRRTVGRAAVVTALAAVIFLATWSSTSAGVEEEERASPGVAGLVQADKLATDYAQWLRAAHETAAATAQEQPLPAQF